MSNTGSTMIMHKSVSGFQYGHSDNITCQNCKEKPVGYMKSLDLEMQEKASKKAEKRKKIKDLFNDVFYSALLITVAGVTVALMFSLLYLAVKLFT